MWICLPKTADAFGDKSGFHTFLYNFAFDHQLSASLPLAFEHLFK
jgi:hypothetical protein